MEQKNSIETMSKSYLTKLEHSSDIVRKSYLNNLHDYPIENIPGRISRRSTKNNIQLYRITNLIYDKNEDVLSRLNNVYSAMHGLGLSVIFMIHSDGNVFNLYVGTKTTQDKFRNKNDLRNSFGNVFNGNFPGSKLESINSDQCDEMMMKILPEDGNNTVTTLTSLPSLKDKHSENDQYIQGVEKFTDTMQSEEFTVLIISDPVTNNGVEEVKEGYQNLYTTYSSLESYSSTMSTNRSLNVSESEMNGITDTIGENASKTLSYTEGESHSNSLSDSHTDGNSSSFNLGLGLGQAYGITGKIVEQVIRTITGGNFLTGRSLIMNAGFGNSINKSDTHSEGVSYSTNNSKTNSETKGTSKSHATSYQKSLQQGQSIGSSISTTVKQQNRAIKDYLKLLDDNLKRLDECKSYGMWSSAVYFISPSRESSIIAANAFKGIINGESSALQTPYLNTWFRDENTIKINKYLRRFNHPYFLDTFDEEIKRLSPSILLSTKELSIECGMPYKSIPGLYVREMARFGREVYDNGNNLERFNLGCIYHMGKKYSQHKVGFDIQKLREHVFITGSTGSGKSNTVFNIVENLTHPKENRTPIPTLIIEPAKGEYKQVFGDSFNVYGTNPNVTQLLRINPFKFEDGIHVLEHIDRLVDIFNVCWPMYAAMPSVLKKAVQMSYIQAGCYMEHFIMWNS